MGDSEHAGLDPASACARTRAGSACRSSCVLTGDDGLVDRRRALDPRTRRADELPDLGGAGGGGVGLCQRPAGHVALARPRAGLHHRGLRPHRGGRRRRCRVPRPAWRLVPGHRRLGHAGLPGPDLAASGVHAAVRALLPDPRDPRLGHGAGRLIRHLRLSPGSQRRPPAGRGPDRQHGADQERPVLRPSWCSAPRLWSCCFWPMPRTSGRAGCATGSGAAAISSRRTSGAAWRLRRGRGADLWC